MPGDTPNNNPIGSQPNQAMVPAHIHNGVDSPFVQAKDVKGLIFTRVATQFDSSAAAALANVTNLVVGVSPLSVYQFEAVLFVTATAIGGSKFAISGTCTASNIIYEVALLDDTTNAYTITSRQTALNGSIGQAGTTVGTCTIRGTIKTTKGGVITVQFAQNANSGTSSVLVGSYFKVQQLSII